jgi:Mn2+/Fe2+ NRAMP family transporter
VREARAGTGRFALSRIVIVVLAADCDDRLRPGEDHGVLRHLLRFSVVALPLTFLPILLVANDSTYMGRYRNGRFSNVLGILYFILILAIAVSAIPLLIVTNGGQG